MEKLDLAKKYKAYYSAKAEPSVVDFPEAHYPAKTAPDKLRTILREPVR